MRTAHIALFTAVIEALFPEHRGFYGSPRSNKTCALQDIRWVSIVSPASCTGVT
jgi:hypothetical protein